VNGREPWAYPDFSLTTLCAGCHKARHKENDGQYEPWERILIGLLTGDYLNEHSTLINAALAFGVVRKTHNYDPNEMDSVCRALTEYIENKLEDEVNELELRIPSSTRSLLQSSATK
jgi:hypothetical protein